MENQAGGSTEPERPPDLAADFKAVMQAITSLTEKVDHIQTHVEFIRKDFDTLRGRMHEVEQRVSQNEDTVRDHGADLHVLKTKVKVLEARAEDAENRNRRNNLRILGLPEGAEGMDPTAFAEHLLQQLLPSARFSPFFTVERAHRIPFTKVPQGVPPRTFIFKLLHFRVHDLVMKEARAQGELRFENAKLLIFPDYSLETQKQRKSFDAVRARLRAKHIKYSMLFPARLRVEDGESVRFFNPPEDASTWIDTLPRR